MYLDRRSLAMPDIRGGCLCGAFDMASRDRPRSLLPLRHVPPGNRKCVCCARVGGRRRCQLDKGAPTWRRSSSIARREHCRACGTPLALVYHQNPFETGLHVGSLDEPEQFETQYNYGSKSRLPWVTCGRTFQTVRPKSAGSNVLAKGIEQSSACRNQPRIALLEAVRSRSSKRAPGHQRR